MTRKLTISEDLSLPLDAVTEKIAFLGRTGGGKTYAAMKLCEEMLEANAHVVAIDPVGKWHGLRLLKDGKTKGFPIPVFGGLYGDVPIDPSAGGLIADLIVDKKINAVLDVSQFLLNEQTRFAYDFATRLFQRQKADPSAIHLFIEECQEFIPQNLSGSAKEFEARMLHAFERLWKLGRNAGIGGSLISQRPQEINKKVLNMSECLFVFQMTGPQEKKAVREWVGDKGLDQDLVDTLPYLKQGDCHVWSPVWLGKSEVIHVAEKKTIDASATPKVGAKNIVPKELSPIDVEEIREAMSATIEKAKADDPKELKRTIQDLRRELDAERKKKEIERIEIPRPFFRDGEVESLAATADKIATKFIEAADLFRGEAKKIQEAIQELRRINSDSRAKRMSVAPVSFKMEVNREAFLRQEKRVFSQAEGSGPLGKCERAILGVLANFQEGCDIGKIAVLAGYRIQGSFRNSLSQLRSLGYLSGSSSETMRITNEGFAAIQDGYTPLPKGKDLIAYWMNHRSFGKCEKAILEYLTSEYPSGKTIDQIAEATGYRVQGSFRNSLSFLRTTGLIVGKSSELIRASEELFG